MIAENTFKKKTLELIDNLNDQMKQLEETLVADRTNNNITEEKKAVADKEV